MNQLHAEQYDDVRAVKGTNLAQTIVQASRKLIDAKAYDHARLVHDIYDHLVDKVNRDPNCPSCFILVSLIEAIGNAHKTPEVINIPKIRKGLGLPNPGIQKANTDDIPPGGTPHPEVENVNSPVDVSMYLESFRFPSK